MSPHNAGYTRLHQQTLLLLLFYNKIKKIYAMKFVQDFGSDCIIINKISLKPSMIEDLRGTDIRVADFSIKLFDDQEIQHRNINNVGKN
jgi:hypothetical protein